MGFTICTEDNIVCPETFDSSEENFPNREKLEETSGAREKGYVCQDTQTYNRPSKSQDTQITMIYFVNRCTQIQ